MSLAGFFSEEVELTEFGMSFCIKLAKQSTVRNVQSKAPPYYRENSIKQEKPRKVRKVRKVEKKHGKGVISV